jgi:hypothetical protein
MKGTIKMRGIQLLFFPFGRLKFDQYNVAMEEAQTRLHVVHGLLSQLTVLVLSQLGGYQIWWLSNRFRNFVANRSCG